jgi:rhodanese-related sulfurtransferase
MKKIALLITLVCGVVAGSFAQEKVSAEEFTMQISKADVQIVDVRTAAEFAAGHIEGAVNIDYNNDTFFRNMAKLDKNTPVYLYCKSGGRSAKAAAAFEEADFKKVVDLAGGVEAWTADGNYLKK